jgi:glycosyltransferase involved in cell wall biosynthesis
MMRDMHEQDPRIKSIFLSRNFGHQPAVTAGIHHARGDCVVLIDGDLQDPPEVIPDMVAKWKRGLPGRARRAAQPRRWRHARDRVPPVLSDLPAHQRPAQAPDAGIFG